MNYENKPDIEKKVIPSIIVNPFSCQSYYILDGKIINEKEYWTKNSYEEDKTYSYAIDYNGNYEVISIESVHGIRPVLDIKKSLLTIGPGVNEITGKIKQGTKFFYECENNLYDGIYKYEVL